MTLSSGLETGGAVVHAPETGTVTEGPVLVPHADGDPIPGKNNHSVWVTSLPVPILQSWNEVSMQYNLALFPFLATAFDCLQYAKTEKKGLGELGILLCDDGGWTESQH